MELKTTKSSRGSTPPDVIRAKKGSVRGVDQLPLRRAKNRQWIIADGRRRIVLRGRRRIVLNGRQHLESSGTRCWRRLPLRQLRQRSAGQLRVQSIWTKLDVIAPCNRTVRRNSHFQKMRFVVPGFEHADSDQVRKIHLAVGTVRIPKPQPVIGPRFSFDRANHCNRLSWLNWIRLLIDTRRIVPNRQPP